MTLGTVAADGASPSAARCSCCGAQMGSYYRDQAPEEESVERLISESFLTANGGALYLPRRNSSTANDVPHTSTSSSSSQRRNKQSGNLPKHLHTMLTVLRPEDTIRLAVRLEGATPQVARYMVVVSTSGRQDTEESALLGMDFASNDSCCTVGLVLPLWSDTMIHLDGDGGFTVSTVNRVHVFKPVSVQAMWSALQSLHKACEVARRHNYYPGSLALTWVGYYHRSISSSQVCINEWNALQDVEPNFAKASLSSNQLPTERENMERLIRKKLRDIMMQKDLESVTCKEIRTELELQMVCDLAEFKKFIGNEMIVILGQMDSPTEVFEHVYLGSEWNASNLDELQTSGVRYILNVTREIDNFFPGLFEYHNIRVYDEEATNLLEYWNDTYKFISKAKKAGSKCLVHCKMGISRSASTVIAYAMKEYGWDLDTAFEHVKERRSVTQPNPAFMKQLEEYQGILLASKQRHNKLWRSHSDFQLAPRPQSTGKPTSFTSSSSSSSSSSSPPLGRSDHCSSNSSSSSSSSLNQLLNLAVLQVLTTTSETQSPTPPEHRGSTPPEHRGSTPPEHRGSTPPEHRGPTPRPQAATLVLGEQLSSEASVAVTMPVAVHHVPASTSEPSLLTLDPLFFSTSDPLILTNDIPLLTSEPHPSIPDHLQLTPDPKPSTLDSPTSEPSLSLTPDPPSLTFEPPASLTPDLPPLTSEPPLSSTFEPPPLISDPQLLIFDALSLNPAISHLTFEPPTSEPPLSSTPDPPPLTFELPVSLTPKPPPLTFKPPVSLTLDLPPLTFEPPISLTPDPPHLTSDPQLLILEPQIFSTSDPEPAIPDHLLLTPDPKPSTLDPLTTEPLPPLTPEPPPLTSHPQCGQSSAEHTDMSPVSSEKSRPEEGGVTLSCWQSQSPWLPELFERSDLLLDRSFLHSHDIAPFNQTSPSPTGGNGAHTNDICQTREAFVGQDPSWSRHSHQRAPQSTRQEKSEEVEEKEEESAEEEEEEEEGLQSTQHGGASEPTLTSISWLSAPHFGTEVEAVQQPPTSPASPRCSTGWAEPLSPDCVGKAPLTTTTTDEDVDDYDDGGGSGHVLPASELKESNSHTLGWRPSNVTLNGVTLQESDTGGALVPQLWGPSPSVDSHELETFPPEDLSPTVERREQETFAFGHVSPQAADPQDLEHFPCQGLSPSVDGWRGRGEDQKGLTPAVVGLGVRLRQAGLTPPSLLKRSASLAKLDHLQLSTLDLSDLDPRSSRRLGGTEPR